METLTDRASGSLFSQQQTSQTDRRNSINMPKDVSGYLTDQQRKNSGDVATEWGKIEELYNKK